MRLESLTFIDAELPLGNDLQMKLIAKHVATQLRPNWNSNKISFETFTAGITNKVFCVIHKSNEGSSKEERMIFRVYGKNTDKIIDREAELKNWLRLAAVGCAAPLYGTFNNGLVCGYLPGKSLKVEALRDSDIYPRICKAMSRIHRIRPNAPEMPSFYKQTEKFIKNFSTKFSNEDMQRRFDIFAANCNVSLINDYSKLKELISVMNSDIVFCHNDLLVHNIVYCENTGKLTFIDYEYADFNYRCFDIANHFNEYAGVEDVDYSLCPTDDEKRQWIEKYLEYYLRRKPLADEVDKMLQQIPLFEAASHFLWAVWALVQSQISTIDFDYLGFVYQFFYQFEILTLGCFTTGNITFLAVFYIS
ncbi:unnamed protein product [Enterobius vermicularis]|uniref:ethanolamine kinase n=1 Tax=Enterobius vermicularis TaxID=51028 RepID=A0A0N4VD32_ENTVE|nr:unnamed protein product [Enterobius vermicularis]